MITMYCVTGGDVLSPGAPLSDKGRDGLKRLLLGTVVGRVERFDCVIAWPIPAAEAIADIIAPGAQKVIRFPEMEPEKAYRVEWARYRSFRESHLACKAMQESVENAALFACLAVHIEEQLTSILATASENAETGVIVLPRPLAGIMFAHTMKAPPMWTLKQGDAFMINYNREGKVCKPSPRLIEALPA